MNKKGRLKLIGIAAVCAAALIAVSGVCTKSLLKLLYPRDYSEYVEKYSGLYGIDRSLLYALIKTESGFDSGAVSSANAIGLTQITEETYDWLKMKLGDEGEFSDLFDAETSVKYGAFFIKYLLDEFGSTPTAFAAYHAGRTRVNGWLKNPELSSDGHELDKIPISETAHYVKKATKALDIYTRLYS